MREPEEEVECGCERRTAAPAPVPALIDVAVEVDPPWQRREPVGGLDEHGAGRLIVGELASEVDVQHARPCRSRFCAPGIERWNPHVLRGRQ
jgi:hypothetical protein